ncbi:MAG: PD-(D/E)XK nuclease family protein, partial [Fidelibacterota bacterium]
RRLCELFEDWGGIPEIDDYELGKIGNFIKLYNHMERIKDRADISHLIERIISGTGYISFLISTFNGKQKVSNVYKLIEISSVLERRGLSPGRFISYIERLSSMEVREGEAPLEKEKGAGVTLMTIHKAKGLEFPIVFIPDVSRGYQDIKKNILFDPAVGMGMKLRNPLGRIEEDCVFKILKGLEEKKEIAESKRVFYVAATRARDYLVISGIIKDPSKRSESVYNIFNSTVNWFNWLDEVFSISGGSGDSELNFEGFNICLKFAGNETEILKKRKIANLFEARYDQIFEVLEEEKRNRYADLFKRTAPIPDRIESHFLTVTRLEELNTCPFRYKLKFIYGFPEIGAGGKIGNIFHPASRLIDPLKYGEIVHKVLEFLDFNKPHELPQVVDSVLKSETGIIGVRDEMAEKIEGLIRRFFNTEIYSQLTGSDWVEKEVQFSYPVEGKIVEGKIDCLYSRADKLRILDYKTDNISPDEIQQAGKKYEFQLGLYCLGVKRVVGELPHEGIIYFLIPERSWIKKVSSSWLEDVERKLFSLVRLTAESNFFKNVELCDTCGFYEIICKNEFHL